jgi:hypothetical protein
MPMQKRFFLLLTLLFIFSSFSETYALDIDSTKTKDTIPTWKISGAGSFNFTQGVLSNWVEGGESSISLLSLFNLNATYKKNKSIWTNTADYKFGLLKSGETGIMKKTEDKLELNSKYGFKAIGKWYYSIAGNFRTQFFRGYNYPNDSVVVSAFMSPAYWIITIGMDLKVKDKFSLFLSPLTSKTTIVSKTNLVDETKYGLEKNQRIKNEKGAYVKVLYKFKLDKNIDVNTKLELFSNYTHNPQNIDINSETTVNMKINKYLSVTLLMHFIYDDDINIPVYKIVNGEKKQVGTTKGLQFKEIMGIGLSYKF